MHLIPGARVRRLLCGLAALALLPAPARPLDYGVDLQAPLALRKQLEEHLDLYRWRGNERLDEAQFTRLIRQAPAQVRSFLATDGYYTPTVTVQVAAPDGQRVVRLAIEPGEPTRVDAVALEFSGACAEATPDNRRLQARMRGSWSLREGAVFRHADWETAKRNALTALLVNRYPAARIVDSRATVDPKTRRATLRLHLDSGPAFTFGALAIQGLQRYPATLVERLNPIRPGEPYDQAKLLELQTRLQDSRYFASADVEVAADPAHPDRVPVQVTVTENPARKLGFGIGLSTDSGPRGQIDYSDLDIFHRAWRLTGNLKVDAKSQSFTGALQLPHNSIGYQDSLDAQMTRTDIEGEVVDTLSLGAKRSRIKGVDETSWGVRYYLERQRIAGAEGEHRQGVIPSWSWTRRQVDNLVYPRRGHLLNLQTDVTTRALLSDQDFLRGYGRVAWFRPLGRRDQLIARAELGAVLADSRDGIPADFLFRTGGDQTVRGYAYQSLGVAEGDAVVGGRWLATASLEYVHWLTRDWGAALFVDAGDAADSPGALHPALGYGVGARWKSPVGPLNLDLARGEDTGSVRLHFTVGFNF